MNKALKFSLIVAVAPIIGGLYGIINDQLTYTISPEYYTKFKFIQFGFADSIDEAIRLPNKRLFAAAVGFFATWWMGLIIGVILGLLGLTIHTKKTILAITLKSLLITTSITFLFGLIGLCFGKFYLSKTAVNWWFPDHLDDKANYIIVGSMHNFSYCGSLIGLLISFVYSLNQKESISSNSTIENKNKNT